MTGLFCVFSSTNTPCQVNDTGQFTFKLEKVNHTVYIAHYDVLFSKNADVCSQTPRSQQKREAIMLAAKQAFQEQGVQNTSMDRIAQIANVSKRTVYRHFKNKEELAVQIISELWTQLSNDNIAPFNTNIPINKQLNEHVSAHVKLVSCAGYIAPPALLLDFICTIQTISKAN